MPTRIPFNLNGRFTNEPVAVELVDDVNNDAAAEISRFNQRSKLWKVLPRWIRPDDLEWQWDRKVDRIRYGNDEKWIILRSAATATATIDVLGLLVLARGRSLADPSLDVAYIKLLAVHPKHRSVDLGLFRLPGEVKGVALALLLHAQKRANAMTGRDVIGLHALGRSARLYQRLGLERFPEGDKDGQPYFEGTIR